MLVDGGCYHILTRGNNRAATFHDETDFQRYGQLVLTYFPPHGVQLYHYCWMTNHVHLVVRAATGVGLRRAMQGLTLRYALAYKRRYSHTGHFWQDWFKSLWVADDNYLLACGAYVELNPVRARMVRQPERYPWSSYRAYAFGDPNPLLTENPLYATLGDMPAQRQAAYQQFVQAQTACDGSPTADRVESVNATRILIDRFGPPNSLRPRGRPRKITPSVTP